MATNQNNTFTAVSNTNNTQASYGLLLQAYFNSVLQLSSDSNIKQFQDKINGSLPTAKDNENSYSDTT